MRVGSSAFSCVREPLVSVFHISMKGFDDDMGSGSLVLVDEGGFSWSLRQRWWRWCLLVAEDCVDSWLLQSGWKTYTMWSVIVFSWFHWNTRPHTQRPREGYADLWSDTFDLAFKIMFVSVRQTHTPSLVRYSSSKETSSVEREATASIFSRIIIATYMLQVYQLVGIFTI